MLDPVGQGAWPVLVSAVRDDADSQVNGAVADGVRGNGPARRVGSLDPLPQRPGVGLEIPRVARVVRVAVAAVLRTDGRGFAQQRAVQEHLGRPEGQVVVSEPARHAQVQAHGFRPGCAGTRACAVSVKRVEHVEDRHELGSGVQPASGRCALVGGQFNGAVADPAAADARLREAGDAFGRVVPGGPVQRGFDGLEGVRQDQLLDELLRRLLDQPGGPAAGVADDHAAVGIGERRRFGACQPQRGGVHHGHVAGVVPDEQRPVPGDPVQHRNVRELSAVLLSG